MNNGIRKPDRGELLQMQKLAEYLADDECLNITDDTAPDHIFVSVMVVARYLGLNIREPHFDSVRATDTFWKLVGASPREIEARVKEVA
jgi:hypothetical protein